jgi:hypothetical protein
MSKIYFKSNNESEFEILKGSHIAIKETNRKWFC